MRRETVNYFYVGLFVLAALVVCLYVLFRVTSGVGQRDTYYTVYRNVAGLSRGTLVTYQGYSLGHVGRIEPGRDAQGTRYRVELLVRKDWQIPDNSVARIYSEGLLADTVVNIDEGDSPRFLSPGNELKGEQGIDLFAAIGAVAGDFGDLSENAIRPLLESLNATVQQVGGEFATRVPVIMDDMQRLVAKLNDSADQLSVVLNEDTGAQARRVLDNVDAAAEDFRALSGDLVEVREDAQKLIRGLDALVSDSRPDVQRAVRDLRHILEKVSRYSDGILHNLDSTSRNMSEFSRQIRENPGRLLGGSAPQERGAP